MQSKTNWDVCDSQASFSMTPPISFFRFSPSKAEMGGSVLAVSGWLELSFDVSVTAKYWGQNLNLLIFYSFHLTNLTNCYIIKIVMLMTCKLLRLLKETCM